MSLLRRFRPPKPSDGPVVSASASTPQAPGNTPWTSLRGIFGSNIAKSALARMKKTAEDSLGVLQKGSRLAGEATSGVPIAGLSIAFKALDEILRTIQTMKTTIDGVQELHEHIVDLVDALDRLRSQSGDQPLPPQMLDRMSRQETKWQRVAERAQKIKSRGKIKRFLTSDADAQALKGLVDEMNRSIQDDMLEGIRNIERDVHQIRNEVGAVAVNVQAVQGDVGLMHRTVKAIAAKMEVTFLPTYAKMAPYNTNGVRRSCLEGTRVDFLQTIYARITTVYEQGETALDGGIVLWINGFGGTGKTTVAHTLCEWCDDAQRRILGGSFFCSRADNDCSDPSLVFPTLCRQLCENHGPFKDKVEEVLQRTPGIASYGLYRQFEELIVQPLEALGSPFPRSVFVLDALDELKNKGSESSKSTILSVISKFVPRIAKFLLFVITSRPEPEITALFEAQREDSLKDTTTALLMHDIPLKRATEDIKLYVDSEFKRKIGFLGIEPDWPSTEEKNALAEQSQGLFIYAATAIKFIMDEAYQDPMGQMRLLVSPMARSSTPQVFLSSLYTTILVASYARVSPELASRLRDVLGAVVLAQEPLSPLSIARLIGLDTATVRSTLTGLHSVLRVPAEENEPIRIIHPTFPEFLLQPPEAPSSGLLETAPPALLHLQLAERHWYLFSRCLEVMSSTLHRDMIKIRYPAMWRSEVKNLEQRVNAAVESRVSYASQFWGHHLREGSVAAATKDVSQPAREFVSKTLLYWIETCSLLDAIDKVVFALDAAGEAFQTLGGRFAELVPILADCRRFVLTYSPRIHAAPLQLYHCALGFAPTASHIRTKYSDESQHALIVEYGAPTNWAPCLDTVAAHHGNVLSVAFSPDGSCFVTGGAGGRATIRKTATRTPVLSFDGHGDCVLCVAFSPEGLHVASGGEDKRVFVWRASSGECVHALVGHTGYVNSVAYSGDGRRILSATERGEVKLWDTTDGRCLLTLDPTGNFAWQVGISFDGGVIARGDGASISLYNVASSTGEALEFPDEVRACTFSPDGRFLAARSWYVIRVWAWPDKSLVRSVDISDKLSGRLAFSRDGTLIGCGSEDGSVRLWTVTSEHPPCTLRGHFYSVNALACSPGMSQVISVAYDGTIRVWDGTLITSTPATEHNTPAPPPPHPGPARYAVIRSGDSPIALLHLPSLGLSAEDFALGPPTVVLFPDVISASDAALQAVSDWYTRTWAFLTGQQHTWLSWRPFAMSLDASLIAYPSPTSAEVVDIRNLRTGTVIASLTGNTGNVFSIAFSPDNARLVTGSKDQSVKVWDTLTGALICGHTKHRGSIRAVTFSPNGRLVASSSDDITVLIFELSTGRIIRVADFRTSWATHVMFAADNVHLVVLEYEGWVYVWDITTGACVREFSLHDHDHLRFPVFSPDGTGILVSGNHGAARTISFWNPGTRTWPVYHVTKDGWVYAMSPGKTQRLFLLPPDCRQLLRVDGFMLSLGQTTSVLDEQRRQLVVLNVSQIQDYIDSLDTATQIC